MTVTDYMALTPNSRVTERDVSVTTFMCPYTNQRILFLYHSKLQP